MKLKNGANRVVFWRNRSDVTLVLARDETEVYRRDIDIDPSTPSETIWASIALHLGKVGKLARQAAGHPSVLQPLMLRDSDTGAAGPCRVLIPFGQKGDYRLEIASNLYPISETVRARRLSALADELSGCATLARDRSGTVSRPAA